MKNDKSSKTNKIKVLTKDIRKNKNINEYLKLLTDKTTINRKYKVTTSIKQEIFEIGGVTMSKEMKTILDAIKAERIQQGTLNAIINMFKKGIIKITDAAKELGVSEKEFMRLAKA